jgi:hypothetical protein
MSVKTIGNSLDELIQVLPNTYLELPQGIVLYYKGIEPVTFFGASKLQDPTKDETYLICHIINVRGNMLLVSDKAELNKYHFKKLDTEAAKVLFGE